MACHRLACRSVLMVQDRKAAAKKAWAVLGLALRLLGLRGPWQHLPGVGVKEGLQRRTEVLSP